MVDFHENRLAFRKQRRLLGLNPPTEAPAELDENTDMVFRACTLIGCLLLAASMFIGGCITAKPAHAYTDEQIVNAIYKAEGGKHAQYPYGIRSISCSGERDCRRICLNTVKHNRIRYQTSESKGVVDFIVYLGSRYCPVSGRSLSKAETNLNKNWLSNVMFFLRKEVA